MSNIFTIICDSVPLYVTKEDNNRFTVQTPNKRFILIMKQDNEGEEHWLEEGSDNETDETKKMGIAIEKYLAKSSL